MTNETSELLTALNNLDAAIVEVMLGLLADTLSTDEQVRFARMFEEVGTLLQQRARGKRASSVPEAPTTSR
jgi:hypothetical protein